VLPGEFVSAIEENGLIVPIGRQFFRDVSAQARIWNAIWPGGQRLAISVNFASHQFVEIGLAGYLLEILDDAGIEPGQISIEITEATAIADLDRTTDVVHRLRDAGIAVILDDFGTGYLSLACLHELPIAGIKLDRSLVRPGRCHPAILETIITLASRLGLSVTAEGIETDAHRDELRRLGCPLGQGYLFARPLDADAAGELVRARAETPVPPSRASVPVWSREP
jgi:EAL domain-containing protein (putative c-di-GMP-specific phosphodiesterase class I)